MGGIEQLVAPVVVGLLSGGIGVYAGQAVQREQISRLREDLKEHKDECAETFKRAVFKDVCDLCGKNGEARHTELIRMIDEIRAASEGTKSLLIACFDNLAKQMREGK